MTILIYKIVLKLKNFSHILWWYLLDYQQQYTSIMLFNYGQRHQRTLSYWYIQSVSPVCLTSAWAVSSCSPYILNNKIRKSWVHLTPSFKHLYIKVYKWIIFVCYCIFRSLKWFSKNRLIFLNFFGRYQNFVERYSVMCLTYRWRELILAIIYWVKVDYCFNMSSNNLVCYSALKWWIKPSSLLYIGHLLCHGE